MMTVFAAAFSGTLAALLKIILVVLLALVLVRRGVMTSEHVSSLSKVTVDLFLPCLIFAKVLTNFRPGELSFWWVLPVAAIAMPAVGLAAGALVFATDLRNKRHVLPLASMQNAGYLVLPVGLALYPQQFDTFAVYCFLFILGFNPVLWSVGKFLATSNAGGWRGLLTPPLWANLIAVGLVLAGLDDVIPTAVLAAIDLIGQAAVPVATIVLGAVLATVRFDSTGLTGDALRIIFVKFLVLPVVTIAVLLATSIHETNPLLASFFVLEASAAPAVGLILQVRTYGGDERRIGALMLITYSACIFGMPFWLAVWSILGG